ncbi:hypothetical protein B0H14DRAFT_3678060 [Mycena olivaceomarginata]|nr:hypothetical protein B0H14DRAFT_3678060 [Mycena olivaceomarginata]
MPPPTITQTRLQNVAMCLTMTTNTLQIIADSMKTPFLGSIINTTNAVLKNIQTVNKHKEDCVQLLEQIHILLDAIIILHIKADAELPIEVLDHIGKFTEYLSGPFVTYHTLTKGLAVRSRLDRASWADPFLKVEILFLVQFRVQILTNCTRHAFASLRQKYRPEAIIWESLEDEYGYSKFYSSPLVTNTQTTGINQVTASTAFRPRLEREMSRCMEPLPRCREFCVAGITDLEHRFLAYLHTALARRTDGRNDFLDVCLGVSSRLVIDVTSRLDVARHRLRLGTG